MVGATVERLLENLEQLMKSEFWYVFTARDQIESIYKDLQLLRDFCKHSEEKGTEDGEVKNLASQIVDVVDEAADIIDTLVVTTFNRKKRSMAEKVGLFFCPHRMLHIVKKKIRSLVKAVEKIDDEKLYGTGVPQFQMSSHRSLSRYSVFNPEEEIMVGFDHELKMIKERLTGASKQLDIISIIGMGGLGKTTLAKKLYNDPYIVYHFYIRGWVCVSQAYHKRELLLQILRSILEHKDEMEMISDDKLGEVLYKQLKGKRYFIVIDDIWSIEAWDELKIFFPNDINGSRILFTRRVTDVAKLAKPDSPPYVLPFLTQDESWELLQQKVFREGSCPQELIEIGKQIAGKCGGLPLAIVVIVGLLSETNKTEEWWGKIAESVSPCIGTDPNLCLDTLALSYNHLPLHLKPCFLYFGAFPEDQEISARKLIWIWIAERFIPQIGDKSLEDVAEEFLMDLIGRSLVLVARRRAGGQIKACRIHDLVRDLCLRIAKEKNFFQQIHQHHGGLFSCPPTSKSCLCIPYPFSNLSCGFSSKKSSQDETETPMPLLQTYGCEQRRLSIHLSSSSFSSVFITSYYI